MPQQHPQSRRNWLRSYSIGRIILGIAVLVVVFFNFWLAPSGRDDGAGVAVAPPTTTSTLYDENEQEYLQHLQHFEITKEKPVFVVGLPKSGTTSIHQIFQCSSSSSSSSSSGGGNKTNNFYKSQHYCCCGSNRTHTKCDDVPGGQLMAECMRKNYKSNTSILQGCGNYDVYAQMDAEFGNSMFLPQRFQLNELHDYAPNSTFILNLRPAKDWVKSVTNWYGLGGRFLNRFNIDYRKIDDRHQVLEEIYNNHTQFIRDFVRSHPSHGLLEINITSPTAGKILASVFPNLNESCWGLHNKNKKRDTNKKGGGRRPNRFTRQQ